MDVSLQIQLLNSLDVDRNEILENCYFNGLGINLYPSTCFNIQIQFLLFYGEMFWSEFIFGATLQK